MQFRIIQLCMVVFSITTLVKSQVNQDDLATNCQAYDEKQRLITCDATNAVAPLRCIWQKKVGLGRVTAMTESQASDYNVYGEFSVETGARLFFLYTNFRSTIGFSTTTSHSWEHYEETTWSEETTVTVEMDAPPGCRTMVNEIVGICSFISVRPNFFERVDTCNSDFLLTKEIIPANIPNRTFFSKIPSSLESDQSDAPSGVSQLRTLNFVIVFWLLLVRCVLGKNYW